MICPNPECRVEMNLDWCADIIAHDVEPPRTYRYWECQRCHQFVVMERAAGCKVSSQKTTTPGAEPGVVRQ